MVEWSEADPILRDDDPYNAWAFLRAAEASGQEDYRGSNQYCPVILKLAPQEQTFGGLTKTMAEFFSEFLDDEGLPLFPETVSDEINLDDELSALLSTRSAGGGPFSLTQTELQQFRTSFFLNAAQLRTAQLRDGPVYSALVLVFARENALLPYLKGEPTELSPEPETRPFEFVVAGRPIGKPDLNDLTRQQLGGGQVIDANLAIIDDSLAFYNTEFFRKTAQTLPGSAGLSRFEEIWIQEPPKDENGQIVVGAQITQDEINTYQGDLIEDKGLTDFEAYQEPIVTTTGQTFRPIDFSSDRHQPLAYPISHGTHVASSALQSYLNRRGGDGRRLAMHGVTLPTEVTQDTSGSSLGPYLIAALRQVILWNDVYNREDRITAAKDNLSLLQEERQVLPSLPSPPLVINLSYGFLAGPKDGSSPLARFIAEMLDSRNAEGHPTALVLPMGNSYTGRQVANAAVSRNKPMSFDWVVQPDDRTSSFLEVFARTLPGAEEADFSISVTPPDSTYGALNVPVGHVRVGPPREVKLWQLRSEDGIVAAWWNWGVEPDSIWDRRGILALSPIFSHAETAQAPFGRWQVTISTESEAPIEVLAMVQRDDTPGTYPTLGRQSYLDHPELWTTNSPPAGRASQQAVFANFDLSSKILRAPHKTVLPEPAGLRRRDEGGPITQPYTSSELAAIRSDFVFVAGAGMGRVGDAEDQPPEGPSPYASEGPKRAFSEEGPDFSGLADRSHAFPGIYQAGTASGVKARMNGSSVTCPELAGIIAAVTDIIPDGIRRLQEELQHGTSVGRQQPDGRFGPIDEK